MLRPGRRLVIAFLLSAVLAPVWGGAAIARTSSADGETSTPSAEQQQASIMKLENRLNDLAGRLDEVSGGLAASHQRVETARAAVLPESAALSSLQADIELASKAELAAQSQVAERADATSLGSDEDDGYLYNLEAISDLDTRAVVSRAVAADGNVEATLAEWAQAANNAYDLEMDRYRATLWAVSAASTERATLIHHRHDLLRLIASVQSRADELTSTLASEQPALPTGGTSSAPVLTAGNTYRDWALALTRQLQAPACPDNVVAIVSWESAEGTDAAWNPLATTLTQPGSTSFNSSGVQNYPSLEAGLAATERTLAAGASSYGYGNIVASLRACAPAATTAAAINASAWCRGCALGWYVTGLVPEVQSHFPLFAGRVIGGS